MPEAVRSVVLDPGERRTSWALTGSGDAVVATDAGLRIPGSGLLRWPDVEKATWQRPHLDVVEVAAVSGTGRRWRLDLVDEGDLPAAVHSAVTASVAWSTHVRLEPAGGVRIVGRRRPDQELLDWQVVYDRGTDPDDPALQAQAEALVVDARRTIG
ncbi:MAG: hypothetical protein JWN08_2724 [Frankiales bacterium]|nr:hypothetical protein [Frankiales bacterium]